MYSIINGVHDIDMTVKKYMCHEFSYKLCLHSNQFYKSVIASNICIRQLYKKQFTAH